MLFLVWIVCAVIVYFYPNGPMAAFVILLAVGYIYDVIESKGR